jgi:hypothetical protein
MQVSKSLLENIRSLEERLLQPEVRRSRESLNNLRAPDRWMSIATAVLLAGYFAVAVYAPLSPSSDPQRGMADGFIILVALILLAFGGALWFGVARNHPWLIRIVFVVTVLPAISQAAQSIFLFVHHAP